MSFIYCQSCGSKIEYTTQKPNFCSKCGTALASIPNQNTKIKPPAQTTEPSEIESVPKITKIDCEISGSNHNDTIGSVIGKGSIGDIKRAPYVPRHGSASNDSLEFCRSSKTRDIDESG